MELRISVFKFLEILEEFKSKMFALINSEITSIETNSIEISQNLESTDRRVLYNGQNDFINLNVYDNIIFSKEFVNSNLYKNEKKPLISDKFQEESELYYISNNNLTKLDRINRQKGFSDLFFNWFFNLKTGISEKIKQFLNRGISVDKYSNTNYKFMNFNSKSEFEQFLRNNGKLNIETQNVSREKFLFKFFKEFYVCLKLNRNLLIMEDFDIGPITEELVERMKFLFYDIGKRNYFEEDFELHKAVYENNLRMIRKICAMEIRSQLYCDINELDSHGNTPLMLAIKLKNLDVINVLCDHDADLKHKSYDGDPSPIEYALSTGNKEILKVLINGVKKQKITNWENNKKEVLELIKKIPDFSMELKLNFDSNIFSLFSSITPSDSYKFYKSGGNLRIDLNISSMNYSFKSIRGKCSIILQEKGNIINVYKVDHVKKVTYDYIDYLGNAHDEDEKVEKTLLNGLNRKKIITKNFHYVEQKQKKEEKILNYTGVKQVIKGDVYFNKMKKKKKLEEEDLLEDDFAYLLKKSGKSFSIYFENGLIKINSKKKDRDENTINQSMCSPEIIKTSEVKETKQKDSSVNNFKKIEFHYSKDYMQTDGNVFNKAEYLNSSRKNSPHNLSESLSNLKKKSVEMSLWICESFPIKIFHFIPLVHILSFISNDFTELKSILCSDFLPFNSFPLKICFPLGFSFHALLSVKGFQNTPPHDSAFELPYLEKEDTPFYNDNFGNLDLNNNYATNFYERYYLEQNRNGQDDLDFSNSSNFDRLRELFLTNQDDEKVNDENKNILDNLESNESDGEKSEVFDVIPRSPPRLDTFTNVNFTDANFGFFNGELNFENGAVNEELFEENEFNSKDVNKINQNAATLMNNNNFFSIFESKLDISLDTKELSKTKIKIPPSLNNLKLFKFNPGLIGINNVIMKRHEISHKFVNFSMKQIENENGSVILINENKSDSKNQIDFDEDIKISNCNNIKHTLLEHNRLNQIHENFLYNKMQNINKKESLLLKESISLQGNDFNKNPNKDSAKSHDENLKNSKNKLCIIF